MEVPEKRGLVQKLNMVSGRNAAESLHGLPEELLAVITQRVIVVEERSGQVEGPILELLGYPIVGLRVLALEAHILCHWLVAERHGQGHHHAIPGNAPTGFYASFDHSQLFKRKEQGQVVLCGHCFRFDKVVFREIDSLILHKRRRSGQGGQKTQKAIVGNEFQDGLFHLCSGLLSHHQHPHGGFRDPAPGALDSGPACPTG